MHQNLRKASFTGSQASIKTGPAFWCMMQLSMVFGFLTNYPTNWWLIKKGWKERM